MSEVGVRETNTTNEWDLRGCNQSTRWGNGGQGTAEYDNDKTSLLRVNRQRKEKNQGGGWEKAMRRNQRKLKALNQEIRSVRRCLFQLCHLEFQKIKSVDGQLYSKATIQNNDVVDSNHKTPFHTCVRILHKHQS